MRAKYLFMSCLWIFSAVGAGALSVYSLDVGLLETEGEALARFPGQAAQDCVRHFVRFLE